jgi:hypothetical protein
MELVTIFGLWQEKSIDRRGCRGSGRRVVLVLVLVLESRADSSAPGPPCGRDNGSVERNGSDGLSGPERHAGAYSVTGKLNVREAAHHLPEEIEPEVLSDIAEEIADEDVMDAVEGEVET